MLKKITRSMLGSKLLPVLLGSVILSSCAGSSKMIQEEHSVDVEKDDVFNIVEKSEMIYPGDDQISTLTFHITDKEGINRKVVLKRYWRNLQNSKDSNILTKTIIFHKHPPESKGTAFMVWAYKYGTNKADDRWIYLPILRKVNKLPSGDESGFHGSDLKASDMVQRMPSLDNHRLLREETKNGVDYYVVESIPKQKDASFQYGKLVKWIRKDNYLKEYVDYYDYNGEITKRAHFQWTEVNGAKVWEKVEMDNIPTQVSTILDITDISVNTNFQESVFTERTMRGGLDSIRE